ncbi:MAG TPA: hypothetical protein VFI84_01620 [Candidatus Saccharimonadales bacterium]|nr:hypothetical protein [Candidatus Saccharimonadales bacterium]
MKKLNQNGIAHLALILVVVVVAAVAVVGMRIASNRANTSVTPASVSKVKVPTKFSNKTDVSNAASALDATNVETGVNPNSLDQDLSAIL